MPLCCTVYLYAMFFYLDTYAATTDSVKKASSKFPVNPETQWSTSHTKLSVHGRGSMWLNFGCIWSCISACARPQLCTIIVNVSARHYVMWQLLRDDLFIMRCNHVTVIMWCNTVIAQCGHAFIVMWSLTILKQTDYHIPYIVICISFLPIASLYIWGYMWVVKVGAVLE